METLLIEDAEGEHEVESPVLELVFDYGGTRLRVSDEEDRVLVRSPKGLEWRARNYAAEARAQTLLERYGAMELACIDGCIPPLDSRADYLVSVEPGPHSACSFMAQAVPELRELGWQVDVADDYAYQVVDQNVPWYGRIEEDDEREDWFSLELGIELDGERINLVPALIDLLEVSPEASSFEALAHCRGRYRAVQVGDNQYITLPWERLSRVLRVLADLYTGDREPGQSVDFLGELARGLSELDDASNSQIRWEGAKHIVERARALAKGPEFTPQPASLQATLRPYQHQGLSWMQYLRRVGAGGVLADDMGLGKTLQTIALLVTEKEGRRVDCPCLIVVPTSLVGNWRRELKKFAPHLRVCVLQGPKRHAERKHLWHSEVVITTYPVLIRDLDVLTEHEFHYVILDEAQAIKNPRSQASAAVRELQARHRLCLSGTPVENNLEELWALFDFLMPGFLGTADQFRRRFRIPIEHGSHPEALDDLRERVAPFILRRVKESVATELPPKTELVRTAELSGDQRDLYESIRAAAHGEVRRAIRSKGFTASTITILDALTKLRQVCCDPRLVPVRSAHEVQRSAKYELFFELVERQLAEKRRILVFSQFAKMLGLLADGLRQRDIGYFALTGATQDRQALVDAFERGEADVFLISLKAGGTGLNLTSADTVIHYDPWWNAAAQMQATDRAYRIGQKKPVFVYNLIAAGSVEERMLRLQQRKRFLADTLLGAGAGADHRIGGLLPDEIEDLFAPLSEGI